VAVTSYKTPGTVVSASRDALEWFDVNYAKASDNYHAYSSIGKQTYSDWLRCTNFGFSTSDIPSGSTIDGIEVKIERKADTANVIKDSALYLRKTSGQVGDNKASATYWPTYDAEVTYGSYTDKWNAGLVDTDIVSTDFGIDLSAYNNNPDSFEVARVDCVSIRVYYTVPTPQTLYPSSISQATAIGTPILKNPQILLPSSIVQAVAYGTPTVATAAKIIYPTSIVQAVAIGTPALLNPQILLPSSIVQAVAYGTPKLILFIQPSSIVQAVAIGTPILNLPQLYESYLEENNSRNVRGVYWRAQSFTPQSSHKITSVKIKLCRVGSPGAGTISIKATDGAGKPTGADLCSASIDGNSLPTDPTLLGFSLGAGTNLSAGTKYAIVWRLAGGDTNNYVQTRYMYTGTYAGGAAIESSDSGVTWDVWTDWDFVFQDWGESLAQTILPDSTVQPIAYGTPAVIRSGLILPTSIVQQIIIGTPTVQGGIPGGFVLQPGGIVQQISIGSPTLLKYVWHVILDGQYATETPGVNRAYIIGRDDSGNPVYGTAVDSTELALVGERLDFQPDPAIPTTAQAGDVASAVLSKMRLRGKGGVILIPPNCGQELFDVVQVSDSMANQSAVTFRVVGIRFEYNPKQARYAHKLILGAP